MKKKKSDDPDFKGKEEKQTGMEIVRAAMLKNSKREVLPKKKVEKKKPELKRKSPGYFVRSKH